MNVLRGSFTFLKQFDKVRGENLKLLLSGFLDSKESNIHQGITRTVYGVIRQELLLDYVIKQLSKRKADKIDTDVLILLRIGIYLLIFSDSYHDYAVVNEAVHMTREKAKGFINAILRMCVRDKENVLSMVGRVLESHIKYSISPLLIENLKSISMDLNVNLDYLNQEPLFHLRVNTRDFSFEEVKEFLLREKMAIKDLKSFDSFEVKGQVMQLRNFLKKNKYYYFQNTASQLISIIASKFSIESVLDCCAAPGTKSVTLSFLRPKIKIYATDINVKRIRLLKDFCIDYGLENIKPVVLDGKRLGFNKNFDFIILDAPCTSSGTIRKNPDLKLKINNDLVEKNVKNQYDILRSIINHFSNVYVLYSVCSFIKEETEEVLDRIINSIEKVIEIMDLSSILDDYHFKYKKGKYGFYLLPDPYLNNDLFYISLLKIS